MHSETITGHHRSCDSALALLASDLGFNLTEKMADDLLREANRACLVTTGKVRVHYSTQTGLYTVNAVYSASRGDYLEAVPNGTQDVTMPAMADYGVYKIERDGSDAGQPRGKAWGYIVDGRDAASDFMPTDEDARPYEAWKGTRPADLLSETHSVRGAIMVISLARYRARR
jgi:hypothetical protein